MRARHIYPKPTNAPAGSYLARFCWGVRVSGTASCTKTIEGTTCAEAAFELPDADGVVELVIDRGP